MNELLDNLLTIHEKMSDIVSFVNVKTNIEALNQDAPSYKKMVENTNMLIEVITKFGERIY